MKNNLSYLIFETNFHIIFLSRLLPSNLLSSSSFLITFLHEYINTTHTMSPTNKPVRLRLSTAPMKHMVNIIVNHNNIAFSIAFVILML